MKEQKTVAQIASEYGVHPNQLYKWRKQALEGFSRLIEDGNKTERAKQAEHEHQLD